MSTSPHGNRPTCLGPPKEVIEHNLVVSPGARPNQKKIRLSAPEEQGFIRMPFGLENAGLAFQQTMRAALQDSQSLDAEAYIDDVGVRARRSETLTRDLSEVLNNLRITP